MIFQGQYYLWLIRVRNLDAFKVGKTSFSRKSGLASINFFNSINIMLRAVLVSPYLDSCSFSLQSKRAIRSNFSQNCLIYLFKDGQNWAAIELLQNFWKRNYLLGIDKTFGGIYTNKIRKTVACLHEKKENKFPHLLRERRLRKQTSILEVLILNIQEKFHITICQTHFSHLHSNQGRR